MKRIKPSILKSPTYLLHAMVWVILMVFVSSVFLPRISTEELSYLMELTESGGEECEIVEKEIKKENEDFPIKWQAYHCNQTTTVQGFLQQDESVVGNEMPVPTPPPKA